MRIHTGKTQIPYFAHKTINTNPISIFSGEKPFECSVCFRRFTQSNNLNKHLKTHGGIDKES